MSEWWTYSLSDFLLFSPKTYYRLFELYNAAVWPAHLVALALGLAILALLRGGESWRGRAVAAILAACWAWVAWAYLLERYDAINWAASYFAAGFAIETVLLLWTGVVRGKLIFRPGADIIGRTGLGFVVFALAGWPLLAPLVGRPSIQAEAFGIAPDPTAVATLGVVLAAARPRWGLLVIPFLWCAVSGATLWAMDSPDAPLLPAVTVLALGLAVWKTWSRIR